jgi:hypothetical protein
MKVVREDRFEGLEYLQGASLISERVEASNSCDRTLISGFLCFTLFCLVYNCPFLPFSFGLLLPFLSFFYLVFIAFFLPFSSLSSSFHFSLFILVLQLTPPMLF